jgi:hypothetical protein
VDIDNFNHDPSEIITVDPIASATLMGLAYNYCLALSFQTVIDLLVDKTVLVDFTNMIPFF